MSVTLTPNVPRNIATATSLTKGEAMRNDEEFAYVSCWEYKGEDTPAMYKEPLDYEFIVRQQRNYKS